MIKKNIRGLKTKGYGDKKMSLKHILIYVAQDHNGSDFPNAAKALVLWHPLQLPK